MGERATSSRIVIVPYDPEWPAQFEQVAGELRAALGEPGARIEHLGSTSVPGLAAKPILDIDVVVESGAKVHGAIERLGAVGYLHLGERGIPGRHAFAWLSGAPPERHVYVCAEGAAPLIEHLGLRDYLRSHPADADAYGALKRDLAERFGEDRDGYTDAKDDFVRAILERVGAWKDIRRTAG
jgi:GrpB-like predicted nucleotidyltransferase (UPF0157 family)